MSSPSDPSGGPPPPDRWQRADDLLDGALDLAPDQRAAYLARECGDDGDLRALVERLLRAAESESALDPAGEALALTLAAEDPAPGTEIGRYRLVREIGRGGMAVVYLAERADGEFEHRVALKLIRSGLFGEDSIRRFQRERQILAHLRHPAIAQLFDGGTTAEGRPYFVMEHVAGEPIDQYCHRRDLPVADRLRLFIAAAGAVDHAHRNLVVHRDLKPSNLLVTATGEPKLLDFGIASLLAHRGSAALTRTRSGAMTPAYASPEQVRGESLTTSSDIYQLGLLLYQVLTGDLPYRPTDDSPSAIAKAIRDDPPRRPSGAASQPRDPTVRRRLRGDLDNIVLKALSKQPERRYDSVARLIEDLEHHLAGRPVSAQPATWTYRARKFLGRHLAASLATFGVILLLLATATLYTLGLARERDRAQRAAEQARQVASFLTELFEDAAPTRARGEQVTARELLDRGASWIERELDGEPALQSEMLTRLGQVYCDLALFGEAGLLLEQAVALRRGGEPLPLADSLVALAEVRLESGDPAAAQPLFEQALELREAELGDEDISLAPPLDGLGRSLTARGEFPAARRALERALAIQRIRLGPRHRQVAFTFHHLGLLAWQRHDYETAEGLYQAAWSILEDDPDRDDPRRLRVQADLADGLTQIGETEEARRHYESALPKLERTFGENHPEVAIHLSRFASLLEDEASYTESLRTHRRALARLRRSLGPDHPELAEGLNRTALAARRAGELEAARRDLEEGVGIFERNFGPLYPRTALLLASLAQIDQAVGDADGAIERYRRVVEIRQQALGLDNPALMVPLVRLGRLLLDSGEAAQAEPFLRQARDLGHRLSPDDVHGILMPQIALARCLGELGRHQEGTALLANLEPLPQDLHPEVLRRHRRAVESLKSQRP
ncbi:MAG: serine/threonine-protein kinase [Acidobacteriota bacterium]